MYGQYRIVLLALLEVSKMNRRELGITLKEARKRRVRQHKIKYMSTDYVDN